MEERIRERIKALEAAQQQAIGQMNAIAGALAELRLLLTPDAPIMSSSDAPEGATNGAKGPKTGPVEPLVPGRP